MAKTPMQILQERFDQLAGPSTYDVTITVISAELADLNFTTIAESTPQPTNQVQFVGLNCDSKPRTARGKASFSHTVSGSITLSTEVALEQEVSAEVGIDSTKIAAKQKVSVKFTGSTTINSSKTETFEIPYEEQIEPRRKLWLVAGIYTTRIRGTISGNIKIVGKVNYKVSLGVLGNLLVGDPEYTVKLVTLVPISGTFETDAFTFYSGFNGRDIDCAELQIPEPLTPFSDGVGSSIPSGGGSGTGQPPPSGTAPPASGSGGVSVPPSSGPGGAGSPGTGAPSSAPPTGSSTGSLPGTGTGALVLPTPGSPPTVAPQPVGILPLSETFAIRSLGNNRIALELDEFALREALRRDLAGFQ